MHRHFRLIEEQNGFAIAFREQGGQQQQQLQVPVGNPGYEELTATVLFLEACVDGGWSRLFQHDIVKGREGLVL